ncbi:MAG: sulfite exporter TauE/SafE family protein [Planctomycetota bacterium]|nr:MAG: sulfite exporter TauE/SafE family protein [Planctomycetota bacterium]
MPAKASVGLVLPLLIFADIFAAAWYHRKAQWQHIFRLLGFAFIGILVATWTLDKINDQQLKPIIGLIVLALAAAGTWNNHRKSAHLRYDRNSCAGRWIFAAVFGFLAGYTTMMANAAGPIMIIYLLAVGLDKFEFVGTMAWFFFIVNWLKVPFQSRLDMITADSLKLDACLFPLVLIGAVCGILLVKGIPQKLFNNVVTVLAAGAAIWMVVSYFI